MQKYILHSTLIGLFSEAFLFRVGFDLKLVYCLVLINFILILSSTPLKFLKNWLFVIVYLFIIGLISVILYNNLFSRVVFQVVGIGVMSLYFFNFFCYTKYSLKYIFEKYCWYAYWISIIGLFFFVILLITRFDFNSFLSSFLPFGYPSNDTTPWLKVRSVFLEPAHFGGVILPAFTYFLFNVKKNIKRLWLIGIALICTFSSITYMGILVSILCVQRRVKFVNVLIAMLLCIALGVVAYNSIDDVKLRVDDTLNVLSDSNHDFSGINLSTYALISNFYVTNKVFLSNPIIGHGIGSHPISHEKYINSEVTGLGAFEEQGLVGINSEDANSLMLRVISELGLIGVILIFIFIKKNYSTLNYTISRSVITYFFYKLMREGHYFSPELYFFVFTYYFAKQQERGIKRSIRFI